MSEMPDKDKEKNAEDLAARLEKLLDEVETDELLRNIYPETLEEKGFIGYNPIAIGPVAKPQITEIEHLRFEPGVAFMRLEDGVSFESITLESLPRLKDVLKGQLIASRDAHEMTSFEPGHNVLDTIVDDKVEFRAALRGKLVIIKNQLHVVPSDVDCRIRIRTDENKMHAYLDCKPAQGDGNPLSLESVLTEMENNGITHGIDKEKIASVVNEANKGGIAIADVEVATGTPPIAAIKGSIEYTFDTKTKEYDFRILPDGRIDYRTTLAILTATENQLLARVTPATPGVPGRTVLGEEIVPGGDCAAARLVPGNGVRVSPDGTEFYAAIAGCIILNGPVLDVVNIYVVNGDVDYSTGNISFNGNVVINGTVLDGFEVNADGDIVVLKCVESAILTAGRDVIVKSGVLGRGKGLISAGRDIRIGYAQNARLEAQGDIYIGNYAINSSISTSKRLIMQERRGAVIGGEVFALRGIDVKNIGSENETKTYVESGTDYLVMRTINEMDGVIAFCEQNVRKIENTLEGISDKLGSGVPIQPSMKPLMRKALDKKRDLEKRIALLQAKRSDLHRASLEKDTCSVKVRDVCFPKTSLKIKELRTVVTNQYKHVRFYDDPKTGEIVAGSF